jgi:transposase-like protein
MRKQHSAAFKTKVVLASLRENKTLSQLATEYEIHPTLLTKWRDTAVIQMTAGFERGAAREEEAEATEKKMVQLYEQIGRLTLHVNWLKKKSGLDPESF